MYGTTTRLRRPKVGDIVTYETFGGGRRTVRVTDVYSDIKNGQPGFDGQMIGHSGPEAEVWGYNHQIVVIN